MRLLLLLLLLAVPALTDEARPRVVLVAEDGDREAATLRDLGFEVTRGLPSVENGAIVIGLGSACRDLSTWSRRHPEIAGVVMLEPGVTEGLAKPTLIVAPDGPVKGRAEDLNETNSEVQKAVRRFVVEQAHLPVKGLKGVTFVQSPNWGVRSKGDEIDCVVVHATVINTMEGTQRAFLDDKVRRVSAHYVIDRDGTIVQMVDERLTAWHAGVSELDGRPGVNDFSVGVELINLNDGVDPYPPAQVAALVKVIKDLRSRWNIPDDRIVSHEQIARPVGRKSDPKGFDFPALYELLR